MDCNIFSCFLPQPFHILHKFDTWQPAHLINIQNLMDQSTNPYKFNFSTVLQPNARERKLVQNEPRSSFHKLTLQQIQYLGTTKCQSILVQEEKHYIQSRKYLCLKQNIIKQQNQQINQNQLCLLLKKHITKILINPQSNHQLINKIIKKNNLKIDFQDLGFWMNSMKPTIESTNTEQIVKNFLRNEQTPQYSKLMRILLKNDLNQEAILQVINPLKIRKNVSKLKKLKRLRGFRNKIILLCK